MTQEDIIRMAREAGFSSAVGKHIALDVDLERFAVLVAAAEREACAKVCEDYTENEGGKFIDYEGHGYECAVAIRARGNT